MATEPASTRRAAGCVAKAAYALRGCVNATLDRFVRPTVRLARREVSSFRACGYVAQSVAGIIRQLRHPESEPEVTGGSHALFQLPIKPVSAIKGAHRLC